MWKEIVALGGPQTRTREGGEIKKCWLSYPFHTRRDRRFDIHAIDEWKGTMAKSDGLLFKTTSPMSPLHPLFHHHSNPFATTPPESAVAGRLVWQAERDREREESKGYIKAAPWTVQTSLDRWPVQWLLLRSGASSVRARRKAGAASFHRPSSSQPAIDRR